VLARYYPGKEQIPCPSISATDGIVFESDGLRLTRSVILNKQKIGTLTLLYDLSEVEDRLLLYGSTVGGVLIVSILISLALSTSLRNAIVQPVLTLSELAGAVSRTRDYSVRATKISGDEIGLLVNSFNEMLKAIQVRDDELRLARDELEERVKRRTEELRVSEERFRLLVTSVQDYAIFMLDPSGHVNTWNVGAERIKGYKEEEILGRHFEIFYPIDNREEPGKQLQIAAAVGRTETEGWRVRKDGSRFWANVVLTALRDSSGRLIGFTKVSRDLTAQRKAQEDLTNQAQELARSNSDLQQFAYVASHDLQEPLRMVISYIQILADRYKGKLDADSEECIEFAVEGALRMRQLITGLLAYSRLSNARQPLTQTDLADVLKDVVANLEVAIQESGTVVTVDELPTIMADPLQMSQLFQNLIGNAITFRGEKAPHIQVSAKLQESHWLFSVADNGIGIKPEHYERIFIIFQRLHDRMQYKGTGMGLAICKKIVARRGGRIWVESELGKGSTFFFTIPIFPPQV
jgi:PAS domain S-box-containing protein